MEENRKPSSVAWIALTISILSLVLAWFAYNRAGTDLERQFQQQSTDARQDIRQSLLLTETRIKLAFLLSVLQANRLSDEMRRETLSELVKTRTDLREAYRDSRGETFEKWQDIDESLAQLESQLRTNSANAIGTIQNILEALKREIRTDN